MTTHDDRLRAYEARVREIIEELVLPPGYLEEHGLVLQPEAVNLVSVGPDIFGRERQLVPAAAAQWAEMQAAAAADGITLLLVSAFRGLIDQRRIFVRKINEGQPIDDILRVNAPPGYSEHHSGRAVDVATPGSRPLTEEFELTDAFAWLSGEASRFGFVMTYPRANRFGVVYEPWHWCLEADRGV